MSFLKEKPTLLEIEDNKIIISDDAVRQRNVMILVGISQIFLGASYLLNAYRKESIWFYTFLGIFLLIVGAFCLSTYFKKTIENEIAFDSIQKITEPKLFSDRTVNLHLKNGKVRDIVRIKKREEYNELLAALESRGLKL